MEFDNYCIALVVLVLFFLYIDNSLNLEGFSSLEENETKEPNMVNMKNTITDNNTVTDNNISIQDSEIIGERPKKIKSTPTPSLKNNLELLNNSSINSSPLDNYFSPISGDIKIPKQIPTNILNIGARFGGQDNLGSNMIGSVGAPVKPTQSGDVSGVPVLNNPSIGAPVDYSMNTKLLDNRLGTKNIKVSNIESNNMVKPANKNLELHMVYTNWCGHSKRAMPDFEKVKNELHGSSLGSYNISVIKHDADTPEGKAFAKEHGIKGFPTHFILDGEKKIENGIGRTYDEITNKIKSITGA